MSEQKCQYIYRSGVVCLLPKDYHTSVTHEFTAAQPAPRSGGEPPICDGCGAGPMLDRGGFYDCFACGHTREKDVSSVLADAKQRVAHVIEHEAQGENVAAIMGFCVKGLNQKETFDFLLARHQKLLEIEAATPAPDAAGERPRRRMLLPDWKNHPGIDTVHWEDDWCAKSRCVPLCDPAPQPPEKAGAARKFTFEDFCEPCITTQHCAINGGCLAEEQPTPPPQGPQNVFQHLTATEFEQYAKPAPSERLKALQEALMIANDAATHGQVISRIEELIANEKH